MIYKSQEEISRETLEATPQRAFTFLMAVGRLETVRDDLAALGLDDAEQERAWGIIERLAMRGVGRRTDREVAMAIASCDNWDEKGIRLIGAGLTRHPEERAMVLEGIEPVVGEGAVLNVKILMERLDKLEETESGRRALATLARRGLNAAERTRLKGMVATAQARGRMTAHPERVDAEATYEQSLVELRDWYTEWAEIARLHVTRRDYLISLGLAERRPGEKSATDPVDADPTDGPGPGEPSPFLDTKKKDE